MFCSSCGNSLTQAAAFCPHCGARREPALVGSAATPAGTVHGAAEGLPVAAPDPVVTSGPVPDAPTPAPAPAVGAATAAVRERAATLLHRMRIDKELAATTGKQAAAVIAAGVLVLTLAGFIAGTVTDTHLGLTEWLRLAAFTLGSSFGATLKISGDMDLGVSGEGHASVWLFALTTTVTLAAGGALAILGARQEKRRASSNHLELLGGALTSGATFAAGLLVMAIASRGTWTALPFDWFGDSSGVTFHAHLGVVSALVGGLLLASLFSLAGRAFVLRRSAMLAPVTANITSRVRVVAGDLATPVFFVLTLSVLVLASALTQIRSLDELGWMLLVMLAAGPTAALTGSVVMMGTTLIGDTSYSGDAAEVFDGGHSTHAAVGMFASGSDPSRWWLLLPLLAAVVAGVIVAARRPVTANKLTSVWKTGAVTAAMFGLLGLLLRLHATVSASGSAEGMSAHASTTASGHAGLVSLVLLSFLWGAVARAAGIWLTVPLARRFPRTIAAAARVSTRTATGRRFSGPWAAQLADLSAQLGRPLPAHKLPSALSSDPRDVTVAAPLSAKPHWGKRTAVAGGVLAVLAIAWLAIDKIAIPMMYGPSTVAEAYFDDLSAGNANDALALTGRGGVAHGPLLTKEALAASLKAAPISDVSTRLLPSEDGSDIRAVAVTYKLGGRTTHGKVWLLKDHKHKLFGIWDSWKMASTSGLISVDNDEHITSVTIDGITVPGNTAYEVFPGRHTVTGDASGLYVVPPVDRTITLPGGEDEAMLSASLSPQGVDDITQGAIDAVNACFDTHEAQPENCPDLPYEYSSDDSKPVTWEWSGTPSVNVDTSYGSIDVNLTGTADLTYVDYWTGDKVTKSESVDLSGSLLDDTDPTSVDFTY